MPKTLNYGIKVKCTTPNKSNSSFRRLLTALRGCNSVGLLGLCDCNQNCEIVNTLPIALFFMLFNFYFVFVSCSFQPVPTPFLLIFVFSLYSTFIALLANTHTIFVSDQFSLFLFQFRNICLAISIVPSLFAPSPKRQVFSFSSLLLSYVMHCIVFVCSVY